MSYHKQAPKKKVRRQHVRQIALSTVNPTTEQFTAAPKLLPTHRRILAGLWRV
jgi:hypothetical protein